MVTGASAGIGWAICEALATAGVRVVAVARRRERLEALQQALVEQGVPISDFLPVVCDITKVRFVTAYDVSIRSLCHCLLSVAVPRADVRQADPVLSNVAVACSILALT